jgi:chromosome segregation ATPase
MPEWLTNILASEWAKTLTTFVIGGGLVAFYRARSQNRVDERAQLQKEQAEFRQALSGELGALRGQVQQLAATNDKLESTVNEQGRELERLRTLDEVKTGQIQRLQSQNSEQGRQLAEQATQIQALTDEKAQMIQRLQVSESQRTFLERENGQLRQENQRLREKLPPRLDSQPTQEETTS